MFSRTDVGNETVFFILLRNVFEELLFDIFRRFYEQVANDRFKGKCLLKLFD